MSKKQIIAVFAVVIIALIAVDYIALHSPTEINEGQSETSEFIVGTTPSTTFFILVGEGLLIVALVVVLLPSKKKKK